MEKIRYFAYIKNGKVVSRITTATIQDGDRVHAGIAYCSPKEQFCRKKGRDKALGRAKQSAKHSTYIADVSPDDNEKIVNTLVNYIADFGHRHISFMRNATAMDVVGWYTAKKEMVKV